MRLVSCNGYNIRERTAVSILGLRILSCTSPLNKIFHCSFSFPQRSAIEQDVIVIDADTKEMLDAINFKDMSGVQVAQEK